MNCPRVFVFIALLVMGMVGRVALCEERTNAEGIDLALVQAKAWLYKQQGKDGTWETAPTRILNRPILNDTEGGQWGGLTALSTYALLASGESSKNPKLVPAIEWLKKAEIEGTYAMAFRMLVYSHLPKSDDVRKLAQRDLTMLVKRMKTEGNARGMYDYMNDGKSYSHSRSQYGVLAAWAATKLNLEVENRYWKTVQEAWIRNQDVSGGWGYKHPADNAKAKDGDYDPSPGMTAAGIATLYLTYDGLGSPVGCTGNPKWPEMDKAMAFMAKDVKRFASGERFGHDFPMPTMYAVERVGLASGLRYFGDTDWFRKGSNFLLQQQNGSGSIALGRKFEVTDTALAILFLARGRAPIVMQKLNYSITAGGKTTEGPWNQRPRDVANLTGWMGRQMERELKWQIAQLEFPVEDLLDSQILYISGNKALAFTADEERKLRDYVERGGMIVGNADCSEVAFSQSFQKLGAKLFPMYEFRELPPDSAIYTRQNYLPKSWGTKPRILGLNNGVRELMISIPAGDLGRSWAMNATANAANYEVMADIFTYANDKTKLRSAGQSYVLSADAKAVARKTVKVARLEYAGNFNPEPAGWPRLRIFMANRHEMKLEIETVQLGTGKLNKDFSLAHLTGTAAFTLTEAQRKEIAEYVAGGGTLLIDSAGGREIFASNARTELEAIFPNSAGKMELLPKDHAVYTTAKLPDVEYRNFVRDAGMRAGAAGPLDAPRLKGLTIGGRTAVLFSAEDISHGMLGSPTDGINGYAPEYALALMRNIVLAATK